MDGLEARLKKTGTVLSPLKGDRPKNTLVKDVIQVNNTFSQGQYTNFVVDTKKIDRRRSTDTTGNI